MNQDIVWQIIRYCLLAASTWGVAKGYFNDEQATAIINLLGMLFVFGWGIWVKYGTTSVPDATAKREDVPTVSPVTGKVNQ